jgi:hypothetical protein
LEVGGHEVFGKGHTPMGFSWEDSTLGEGGAFLVYIHHQFLVIDGETKSSIIDTRSATMIAVFYNYENLICEGCGQWNLNCRATSDAFRTTSRRSW